MSKDSPLVAFVGVSHLGRAQSLYGNVLGLEIVAADDLAIVAEAAGTALRITKVPQVAPAVYTVLGFAVDALVAKNNTYRYSITPSARARQVRPYQGASTACISGR